MDYSNLELIDEKCNTEISDLMKLSLDGELFEVNSYVLSDGKTTLSITGILFYPSDSYNGFYLVIPQLDRTNPQDKKLIQIIEDKVLFVVNPIIN